MFLGIFPFPSLDGPFLDYHGPSTWHQSFDSIFEGVNYKSNYESHTTSQNTSLGGKECKYPNHYINGNEHTFRTFSFTRI
jgi:hypothetical protein